MDKECKENVLSANGVEAEKPKDTIEGAQAAKTYPPAVFGFDEEGTFHLQIHSKTGFLQMIGFLYKAIVWMNNMHDQAEKKAQEQKDILLNPTNKGFGRFSLFKPKK